MQLKPKKSLGQNFLKDENILKLIVEKADINKNDNVINTSLLQCLEWRSHVASSTNSK